MAQATLTLKDMMGGSGCTARTVRYYERQGLLDATRSPGGHRLFEPGQLPRLKFIVGLRQAGWSLDDVEALLGARGLAPSDGAAVQRLDDTLRQQIQRLDQTLGVLTRLRADLSETHALLAVCSRCCAEAVAVDCGACEQVPPLSQLPQGFVQAWRTRATSLAAAFDDPSAHGIEPPDEGTS